tara:strand:+ start:220 stop:516 length:297 start_codon:yes stop_codon:yes gene_type:complete
MGRDGGMESFEDMLYCIDMDTRRDVEISASKFCQSMSRLTPQLDGESTDLKDIYLKHLKRNIRFRAKTFGFEVIHVEEEVYGLKPEKHLKLVKPERDS